MSLFSPHTGKEKIVLGLGLGVLAWLAVLALWRAQLLEPFELRLYDQLCRLQAAKFPAPPEIALIVVDQASLEAAARQGINWPWPRQLYAPIVRFCSSAGARALIFDILYTEPSAYGLEDDRILAEAFAESSRVLLPFFLSSNERPQPEWQARLLRRLALPLDNRAGNPSSPYRSILLPIRQLAEAAAGLGNVESPPDSDGIYRRLPLVFRYGGRWLPSLALALVRQLGASGSVVLDRRGLLLGRSRIPLDARKKFLLSFYGGRQDYPRYSAYNVIQSYLALQQGDKPAYRPEIFKDKIVFVGFTAPGLFDLKPTPVNSVYPGVAIHATLAANLLHQHFRVRIRPTAAISLAAGIALLASLTVMLLPSIWQLGLVTLAYGTGLGLFVTVSFRHNLWVDTVLPESCLLLAFLLATAYSYATEGRQKRQIKRMFSHYMSDLLVQDLLRHPDKLRLGGEKRILTVSFSDLAGFTSLSERLAPEEVVALLNRYLTAMSEIILASGGVIDKYEGDAIMAFWGAPLPQDDHAARACLAALQSQERLARLRQEFLAAGLPPIYARIGINTGEMIIGNMGSSQRFDFTVMGDSVNLASRLESASKLYGTTILISEQTYRQAAAWVEVREVDLIQVKGKEVPVRIYELLARKGELDDTSQRLCELFGAALASYRQHQWSRAAAMFQQVLELAPDDGPSRLFIRRCREFSREPPPPSWDGVYRLKSK